LRLAARRCLPTRIFEFVDYGAEDEAALANNTAAFQHVKLRPRVLVDVSKRTANTVLLDRPAELPVAIAPTAIAGLCWYDGEIALARAAATAGVPFGLSTGFTSMEKVADLAGRRLWLQLSMLHDRNLSQELVNRARAAQFEALILTVDNAVTPKREYNDRNGFGIPFKLCASLTSARGPPAGTVAVRSPQGPSFSRAGTHTIPFIGSSDVFPITQMSLTLRSVVGRFEPDSVRILEKNRIIVRRVFWIKLGGGYPQTLGLDFLKQRINILDVFQPKTEVMKARRIGIMALRAPGRPQAETIVAAIVMEMRISADRSVSLFESHQRHKRVVVSLGNFEISDRNINMVNSNRVSCHRVSSLAHTVGYSTFMSRFASESY
jgi:FMN-dependent dehydrogenase